MACDNVPHFSEITPDALLPPFLNQLYAVHVGANSGISPCHDMHSTALLMAHSYFCMYIIVYLTYYTDWMYWAVQESQ